MTPFKRQFSMSRFLIDIYLLIPFFFTFHYLVDEAFAVPEGIFFTKLASRLRVFRT